MIVGIVIQRAWNKQTEVDEFQSDGKNAKEIFRTWKGDSPFRLAKFAKTSTSSEGGSNGSSICKIVLKDTLLQRVIIWHRLLPVKSRAVIGYRRGNISP